MVERPTPAASAISCIVVRRSRNSAAVAASRIASRLRHASLLRRGAASAPASELAAGPGPSEVIASLMTPPLLAPKRSREPRQRLRRNTSVQHSTQTRTHIVSIHSDQAHTAPTHRQERAHLKRSASNVTRYLPQFGTSPHIKCLISWSRHSGIKHYPYQIDTTSHIMLPD